GGIFTYTMGDVASDSSATIDFVVAVNSSIDPGVMETVNMVAIVDDGNNGIDANEANNSGSDTNAIGAFPDLVVTKTNGVATATTDQSLIYTIDYSNVGDR